MDLVGRAWDPIFAVMHDPRRIDKINHVRVVRVRGELEGKKVLVETHVWCMDGRRRLRVRGQIIRRGCRRRQDGPGKKREARGITIDNKLIAVAIYKDRLDTSLVEFAGREHICDMNSLDLE